jgi:hypothetical protein
VTRPPRVKKTMRHVGPPNWHPATARDGPLAGEIELTVANQDDQGRWPTPVVWSTAGERHVYELMALRVGANLLLWPVYAFRRTLEAEESEPEIGWTRPPRYLL